MNTQSRNTILLLDVCSKQYTGWSARKRDTYLVVKKTELSRQVVLTVLGVGNPQLQLLCIPSFYTLQQMTDMLFVLDNSVTAPT